MDTAAEFGRLRTRCWSWRQTAAAGVLATACSACGDGSPTSPGGPPPPPSVLSGVLIGAGDIAVCNSPATAATAALLDRFEGTVFTSGDNAYPNGSAADFRNCYDPTWGRHRDRTRPVPGNHDYGTPGAAAYFEYFGAAAGPAGLGYYRYTVGAWTVFALNSEIDASAGSAQGRWLRTELQLNRTRCTAAIWHRPLFSSGPNGESRQMLDVWLALFESDADIVINGHEHMYERFAPQDPQGRSDPVRGIQQFTVGTGGATLYVPVGVRPNSQVRTSAWGVAKFTLMDGSYQWEFLPIDPGTAGDSGSGRCH